MVQALLVLVMSSTSYSNYIKKETGVSVLLFSITTILLLLLLLLLLTFKILLNVLYFLSNVNIYFS